MSHFTAIGLMSGTSYDGVDVALVETDGEEIVRLGPTGYRPYSEQERDSIRRAIAAAATLSNRAERPNMLVAVEELVTDMHAEAVETFLAANAMMIEKAQQARAHLLESLFDGCVTQVPDGDG